MSLESYVRVILIDRHKLLADIHTSSFDHTVISQVIERNVKLELVEINGVGVCD